MIKTGLYFGSFNPIHIGHLAIAGFMLEFTDIEQLWFIVSPQNPLKEKKSLLSDYHRLDLVRMAIEDDDRFRVSDIEFRMPKPSYTIDTLTYLEERHPNNTFCLIMGADSLKSFSKWKHSKIIIEKYHRLIYPRPGISKAEVLTHPNVTLVDAPQMDISSSFIREAIRMGKDTRYFLPHKVYRYIVDMHFYE